MVFGYKSMIAAFAVGFISGVATLTTLAMGFASEEEERARVRERFERDDWNRSRG